jgi:hypothetical protein
MSYAGCRLAGTERTMAIDPVWFMVAAYVVGAVIIGSLIAVYFRRR